MIITQINDIKEIIDIANDIKELTKQKHNPTREGLEKVIKSVRGHVLLDTELYEDTLSLTNQSPKVNIENVDNNALYSRLDVYKIICLSYLLKKYGNETFNQIIKEYELEV